MAAATASSEGSSPATPQRRHHEPYASAAVKPADAPAERKVVSVQEQFAAAESASSAQAGSGYSSSAASSWQAYGAYGPQVAYDDGGYGAAWQSYVYGSAGGRRPVAALYGAGEYGHPAHYAGAVGAAELSGADLGEKGLRVCRHFARGRCTWGNDCRFSHDLSGAYFDGAAHGEQAPRSGSSTYAPATPPSQPALPPGAADAVPHQSPEDRYVGAQQKLLMAQRAAVLDAAIAAQFQIRAIPRAGQPAGAPSGEGAGHVRGQVILTALANAPDIIITILADDEVPAALAKLDNHARLLEGGLLYLVGETSVFWSAVRRWHVAGTTGSPRWDAALEAARDGNHVPCMFYRTAAGCLAPHCAFSHDDGETARVA